MNKKMKLFFGIVIIICIVIIGAFWLKNMNEEDDNEETPSYAESSVVDIEESTSETVAETSIGSGIITYENNSKWFSGIRHLPANTYTSVLGESESNTDGYSIEFRYKTNESAELIMPAHIEQGDVISVAVGESTLSKITFEEGIKEITIHNVKDLKEVVIPASATSVNIFCEGMSNIIFAQNGNLKYFSLNDINIDNVVLPDTIKYISSSFQFSKEVVSVDLPDSLTEINNCFTSCTSLEQLDVPDSVTKISEGCFSGCPKLTLTVGKDSYAEEFAKEYGIPYQYRE